MIRSKHIRGVMALLLALLLSLSAVTPALADDGVPPPETAPPAEEAAPAPEVGVSELPAEAAPVEAPAVPAATDPGAAPTEELLAEIPDGTTVAVVGEAGEALPLASAEAAEVLATGDPVWCPMGVLPGGAGCTIDYPSLAALVAAGPPPASGVIWIQGGVDPSAGGVVIDGDTNWASASAFTLTLQGGWDGVGTTTIDTANPSVFHTHVWIRNWNAPVTVNDIEVSGVANLGLDIATTGKVALNRVVADGNNTGARIDNRAGSADVVVSASEFKNSSVGRGLDVLSHGQITLASVSATDNGEHGAVLDNSGAPIARKVVLTTGTLNFSGNTGSGLRVLSLGPISLRDVDAIGNDGAGAYLNNASGTSAVTLTGVNVFAENGAEGLSVYSRGAITSGSLVANGNDGFGVTLWNSDALKPMAVTFTGSSQFKDNGSTGLWISTLGAITLANLNASGSALGTGAYLQNNYPASTGGVKLTGVNIFHDNAANGLEIASNGAIALSNVASHDNGHVSSYGYGVILSNVGAASASPVTFSGINLLSGNYSSGALIQTRGAVNLSSVTADGNGGLGVAVDNTFSGTASPQVVTISGTNRFSDNGEQGLRVYSHGKITLSSVTAGGNGAIGGATGVYLRNNTATSPNAVTLSGMGLFEGNVGNGLRIESRGAITIANVQAVDNGSYGAYLDNSLAGSVGAVTIQGTSLFDDNGVDGLRVLSLGTITLKDFGASGNDSYGVYLYNRNVGSIGNVSAGTSRARWSNLLSDNGISGMEVYSYGAVTLSNIRSMSNGSAASNYGLYVNNASAASAKAVSLNGTNNFDGNYAEGLYLLSKGPIKVSNVTASGSTHGSGAYLDNTASGTAAPQPVTLTGTSTFSNNYLHGLDVSTYGAIAASSLTAISNGITGSHTGYGANLKNYLGLVTLPREVKLTGSSVFSGNHDGGLSVLSRGAISAADLTANGNEGSGIQLGNTGSGKDTPQAVTLTGANRFVGNGGSGLSIVSYGPVTLSNLSVDGNGTSGTGYGAYLNNNNAGTLPRNVTLSGTNSFSDNAYEGLWVSSLGAIKISNLTASGNGRDGAEIDNQESGAVGGVTLTGSNLACDNGEYGLWIRSNGAITLSNMTGSLNGLDGARLETQGTAAPQKVTLTGKNVFLDNGDEGLEVRADGQITLSNLTANGNSGDGAWIDNGDYAWSGTPGVTLSGVNTFLNNGRDGLNLFSAGSVTLSALTADSNGRFGVIATAAANILLSCGSMTANGSSGWALSTPGTATLKGVFAFANAVDNVFDGGGTLLIYRSCP